MSKTKIILLTAVLAFTGGVLTAGPMRHHPNLEKAEADLNAAWEHIAAAQSANEYDMGGHAAKAKHLIGDAKEEIRLAAADAGR